MDRLNYLVKYLLDEKGDHYDLNQMTETQKQKLYQSLQNIRGPKEIAEDFVRVQDEYLQDIVAKNGIIDIENILYYHREDKEFSYNGENYIVAENAKIVLWQGDITRLKVDAIVNPANSGGLGCFTPGHNCVDNRIHTLSGVQLRLECNEVMKDLNRLETGQAFVTHSFNLPCNYIIHTAGPVIYDNEIDEEDDEKLSDSYWNSLNLALDYGMKTIAFPCISTGVSQFPNDRAEKIALKTIKRFLSKYNDLIELIVIVAFKPDDFELYYKDLK